MSSSRTLLFVLTVITALGCFSLAGWQANRLFDRRERNALATSQRLLPAVNLNRDEPPAPVDFRRMMVRGTYLPDRDLIIRGRLLRGTPGIQVVTPLRLEDRDLIVLVNRGFVPTPDAGAPPSREYFAERGSVLVDGIAMSIPDQGDGDPIPTANGETWRRLDRTLLRTKLDVPVAPFYLVAEAEPNAIDHTINGKVYPIRIEPPPLDDGPHLSYAVQWLLIGGAALGFGVVFVRRKTPPTTVPD